MSGNWNPGYHPGGRSVRGQSTWGRGTAYIRSVRGRGSWRDPRSTHPPRPPRPYIEPSPAPPAGELLKVISVNDANIAGSEKEAKISDVEHIASFNWMEGPERQILIPGRPPLWAPPSTKTTLEEDAGVYFRDINAAFSVRHPMEASILAVQKTLPRPTLLDIVACGSTLGKLLDFVRGKDGGFRMLVERVDNTIHLIRRENTPKEKIPDIVGYGHTFPEAYTTWNRDAVGSVSAQRLIKYRFGGLHILVRFEVDGYFKDYADTVEDTVTPPTGTSISDAMASMNHRPKLIADDHSPLVVREGGKVVPQGHIFELKTRSEAAKDRNVLGEQLPRLWVKQIPNFVLAYHKVGVGLFEDVQIKNVQDEIDEWESLSQPALKSLARLLYEIRSLVAGPEYGGKMEIVRPTGQALELRRQLPDASDLLAPAERETWEAWLRAGRLGLASEKPAEKPEDAKGDDSDDSEDFTFCNSDCGYCGVCKRS